MTARRHPIEPVSIEKRRRALSGFRDLLESQTKECDWQNFFNENPFIFSDTLSIKLDGLYSQVPLVSGVPDYVFVRNTRPNYSGDYGVIELKRPSQSILGTYSSKIIVPSTSLRVAQQQASQYLDSIHRGQFLNSDDFFVAGNRKHAFIILGQSSEVTQKCQSELHRLQFQNMLPTGFHLYTYDELLELFAATVPPTIQVLFVAPASIEPQQVTKVFRVTWRGGLHARPSVHMYITASHFISDIFIERGDRRVNAKSVMQIMMLAAAPNTDIAVTAVGVDARAAVEAIGQLIRADFYMLAETAGWHFNRSRFDHLLEHYGTITPEKKKHMIREAAYFLAEKDGFPGDPDSYWVAAERMIIEKLRKGEIIC